MNTKKNNWYYLSHKGVINSGKHPTVDIRHGFAL